MAQVRKVKKSDRVKAVWDGHSNDAFADVRGCKLRVRFSRVDGRFHLFVNGAYRSDHKTSDIAKETGVAIANKVKGRS